MPKVGDRHYPYTRKGIEAARKARNKTSDEDHMSTTKVPKFKRRQRILKNARGKANSQIRKKSKGDDFRARVLSRLLQNRSLRESNPDWRKDAGGGKGLFKELRKARAANKTEAAPDEHSVASLARLESRVKNFKTNRSEMLSGSKKMTGGEAPKPGVKFTGKKRKRGGYIGS